MTPCTPTLLFALLVALPAQATLDDAPTDAYRGLCQMTETCSHTGAQTAACGTTPSVGTLLLQITANGTRMGRDDADLTPIDHFATLPEATATPHPLDGRRTFLTDLPPLPPLRRFAVHVQTPHPETGAPVLRPQYFVLSCAAVS